MKKRTSPTNGNRSPGLRVTDYRPRKKGYFVDGFNRNPEKGPKDPLLDFHFKG